jgi:hypothetical protein
LGRVHGDDFVPAVVVGGHVRKGGKVWIKRQCGVDNFICTVGEVGRRSMSGHTFRDGTATRWTPTTVGGGGKRVGLCVV